MDILLPVALFGGVMAAAWAGFTAWARRRQRKTMLEEWDELPGPDEVQRRTA